MLFNRKKNTENAGNSGNNAGHNSSNGQSHDTHETLIDAFSSDPKAIERDAGLAGRFLIRTLDTAMGWQTSAITAYLRKLQQKNPDASPAEIQEKIDSHFVNIVTGTGGGAGGAAVMPGVGFVTGLAAVAVESLFFLEAAAWHTLASARLRGLDISEPQRRRSLILVGLTGSSGTALVAATIGDEGLKSLSQNKAKQNAGSMLSALGVPQLGGLNKMLFKQAQKRMMKSARMATLGKIMPMGIGIVIGSVANRKLGKKLVENNRTSLGPIPRVWDEIALNDGSAPNSSDNTTPAVNEEGKVAIDATKANAAAQAFQASADKDD